MRLGDYGVKAACSNIRSTKVPAGAEVVEGKGVEGDVVVARLVSKGAYTSVEGLDGVDVELGEGDCFLGVLGNRCSGRSVVGGIPEGGIWVGKGTTLSLLCNGGIIGESHYVPRAMGGKPTVVSLEGIVSANGASVNITQKPEAEEREMARLILVLGTGAEVGKTTFALKISGWLAGRGYRVAVAKIAGTGRMRDIKKMASGGAVASGDFCDMGVPSTYGARDYASLSKRLLRRLSASGPDVIVVEGGGDFIWAGLPEFLHDREVRSKTASVVLVPGDAVGVFGAEELFEEWGVGPRAYVLAPRDCNVLGFKMRVRSLVGKDSFDIMDEADFSRLAEGIRRDLDSKPRGP